MGARGDHSRCTGRQTSAPNHWIPTGTDYMLPDNAFLALWNDISSHREPEYDQWHTQEHVPERVSVQGFRGARRYVNRGRVHHRYFTLYEVDSLGVFTSAEYRDLLENPTPWSASMRPDFSNFLRATCSVVTSRSTGIGAAIACLCVPKSAADKHLHLALVTAMSLPGVRQSSLASLDRRSRS